MGGWARCIYRCFGGWRGERKFALARCSHAPESRSTIFVFLLARSTARWRPARATQGPSTRPPAVNRRAKVQQQSYTQREQKLEAKAYHVGIDDDVNRRQN